VSRKDRDKLRQARMTKRLVIMILLVLGLIASAIASG